MEVYFVITIDTEIDRKGNWEIYNDDGTFFSVLDGIPKKLTPLFDQFEVKPTYLLSSEVIENKNCVTALKNTDNCELGTHLHGDLIEPQRKIYKLSGYTPAHAMQCSYPKEIEYQKLKNLTNLFVKKFGYAPTSFRAGRFAAGTNTINSLEKLGYLVDSSITPGICWDFPEGKANFLRAKEQPYFPSKKNLLEEGNSKILEVPISIVTSTVKKYFHTLGKVLRQVNKIVNKIFPSYWLRPSFQSSREMVHVIKKMIKKYPMNDVIVLNMMFHSMEIIPNASPYTRTRRESEKLLARIETVLKYSVGNSFNFVTLSELYPYFCKTDKKGKR